MRRRTENPSFSALSKAIAQVEQVHTTAHRLTREVPYLFTEPVRGGIPVSAGHVKKPDLLCMRPVERTASGVGCNRTLQPFFAK
jgi:hypothetical protein